MNKNRHIIGELQEFFANNDANYSSSALCKLFSCDKDTFYRFMNDGNVNWRRIIYSVFRQLYSRVSRKTTSKSDVKYVIVDDSHCRGTQL